MSIAKRVAEAFGKMVQNDPEGALLPISSAVDATATKYYGRRGRKSYKDFIHENLALITKVGFGPMILNINIKYSHPDLETDHNGLCSIQDILYHVVRCGLAHSAELPSTLKFVNDNSIYNEGDTLVLPASLIYGLIAAVVVCPNNSNQSMPEKYGLELNGIQFIFNNWWGKKEELENQLFASD